MKKNKVILIILTNIFLFTRIALAVDNKQSTSKIDDNNYSWAWSPYLAAGYGYPQGFRFELGYNFSKYITAAFDVGLKDWWSNDPNEGTFGLMGRIFIPVDMAITPYFLVGGGGTISIFGGSDSYTIVSLGAMYPVTNWLALRPEVGIDFTSRYTGGGFNIGGGGGSSIVYKDRTKFYINLSAEFDVMGVFR